MGNGGSVCIHMNACIYMSMFLLIVFYEFNMVTQDSWIYVLMYVHAYALIYMHETMNPDAETIHETIRSDAWMSLVMSHCMDE